MKCCSIICLLIISYASFGQTSEKRVKRRIFIAKIDSAIYLTADNRYNQRLFGYQLPDTNSKKLILFSLFKKDFKDNPYNCPYGVYFQTNEMKEMQLKFLSQEGDFIMAALLKGTMLVDKIYFLREWTIHIKTEE